MTRIKRFDFATREGRQAFYRSREWRALRDNHLMHHPVCDVCSEPGSPVPATVVDHSVDLVDAPELSLEPTNLTSMCVSCHSKKTTSTMYGNDLTLKTRKWEFETKTYGK